MCTRNGIIDSPFIALSFSVPERTTTVTITGSSELVIPANTAPFVHLYIYDSNKKIRGERILLKDPRSLCITTEHDTFGTVKGGIPVGEWSPCIFII